MPRDNRDYYDRLDGMMGQLEALRTRQRQVSERRNELARQLQGEEPTFGLTAPVGSTPVSPAESGDANAGSLPRRSR